MQIFQTVKQDRSQQFDLWFDMIERSFAPCEGFADGKAGFEAKIEIAGLGDCELTQVVAPPIRYLRSNQHVKRSQRDDIFLELIVSGETHFSQNGQSLNRKAGDLLVFDVAKPYEFNYPDTSEAIMLRVPRPLVESRLHHFGNLGGLALDGSHPQTKMISSILQNLMQLARCDQLNAGFMAPALDMIVQSLSLGIGVEQPGTSTHDEMLRRIKTYMLEHLADEDLSLERIAGEQNTSVRSISRLFAQQGTAPIAWLQKKRLATAFAMLAEGKTKSVTDAAFDSGFKDLSHFGRSFKSTYGLTPRQVMLQRSK